jgi:cytochrome c-type biogenesis protein CcmE
MGARRVLLIAVLAAAVLIGFVAVQNLSPNLLYYLTPTEARERNVAAGTAVRLGGQVETGSLRYDPQTRDLRFVLTIGTGAPPSLLREGAGAVVEGTFASDGTFRATQVIAKHDEQYAPPSPGATPSHQTP